MSLQGKVVVITGASAGIGRAHRARDGPSRRARRAHRPRRRAARGRAARGAGAWASARASRPPTWPIPTQVERAAAQIESELGPIDVWVNNAMAAKLAPVSDTRPEEFRRVTEVTYLGSVYGAQAALRRMRPRNRGVIVQVGSALVAARHPAAGELLRRQARAQGLPGLTARRAAARQVRRPRHARPAAGPQHAAVRMGPHRPAPPPAARAADLPARGRRARDRVGRRAPQARAVGRAADRLHDPRREVRLGPDGPLPGPHQRRRPSRPTRRSSPPTATTTCSRRRRATPARTGASTTRPRPAARSCGWPRTSARWPGRPPAPRPWAPPRSSARGAERPLPPMRTGPTSDLWWKNAIVYCLDVETYHDADGDGCGDMAGLIERLDHAARLGATCLWLMPFYPTPNRDDGYDIADYLGGRSAARRPRRRARRHPPRPRPRPARDRRPRGQPHLRPSTRGSARPAPIARRRFATTTCGATTPSPRRGRRPTTGRGTRRPASTTTTASRPSSPT